MRRIIRWSIYFIACATLWVLALQGFLFRLDDSRTTLVQALPFLALIAFGCYSLSSIGWSLVTFSDCEDASKELEKQREKAISFYRTHGLVIGQVESQKTK